MGNPHSFRGITDRNEPRRLRVLTASGVESHDVETGHTPIWIEIVNEAVNGVSTKIEYQLGKQVFGVPACPINTKLTHSSRCSTTKTV